ncbi:MFS transporter [Shimia sagamensis]|uniref:Fucose permease n=1 Tax=Shimia sagamensis TaxID=1566352 RepID=A0ABY1P2K8_9RHOB|nr:MFS transporter [Shimia sagamensis]SMP23333.1 Fucose permease [Shimia sagamensis]
MTPTQSPGTVRLIMALFFLHPFALGGWLPHIPHVQSKLDLTNAQLALSLLGLPLAFVFISKLGAKIVAQYGAPRVLQVFFPIQAVTVVLPLYAINQVTLFLALLVFGASMTCLNVALNVYAGQLEKAAKKSVMNRCHGFWALGLTVGSFLAAMFTVALSPAVTVLALTASTTVLAIWLARPLPNLRPKNSDTQNATKRRKLRDYPTPLFLIVLFVVSVTMAEGAMANWGAVYMAERLPEGASTAGLAITVFSAFVAFGRFIGDFLKVRMGSTNLARMNVGLAIIGLVILVAPFPPLVSFVGFACIGLGLSVGFPLAVSAAAALEDEHDADNIAFLSIMAVGTNVVAPPIIGLLADNVGISLALAALLPGLCLSFVMARHLTPTPELAKAAPA